jgi:hypothetical protein
MLKNLVFILIPILCLSSNNLFLCRIIHLNRQTLEELIGPVGLNTTSITLNGFNIDSIDTNTFSNLTYLENLNINNNLLTWMSPNVLNGC